MLVYREENELSVIVLRSPVTSGKTEQRSAPKKGKEKVERGKGLIEVGSREKEKRSLLVGFGNTYDQRTTADERRRQTGIWAEEFRERDSRL